MAYLPITQSVQVAHVQTAFQTLSDIAESSGDLPGHESLTAPLAFVIEKNAVAGIDAVDLAVILGNPVGIEFGHAAGIARVERRGLFFRRFLHQAIQLAVAGLIKTRLVCITKLAMEKYLGLFQDLYVLHSVALRLSNPFGERHKINSPQGAVAVFLGAAVQYRELQLWGDGRIIGDHVYITDDVTGILRHCNTQGREKFSISAPAMEKHLLDVISVIDDITGRKLKITFHPARSIATLRNVLDISKATSLPGWRPEIPFNE